MFNRSGSSADIADDLRLQSKGDGLLGARGAVSPLQRWSSCLRSDLACWPAAAVWSEQAVKSHMQQIKRSHSSQVTQYWTVIIISIVRLLISNFFLGPVLQIRDICILSSNYWIKWVIKTAKEGFINCSCELELQGVFYKFTGHDVKKKKKV